MKCVFAKEIKLTAVPIAVNAKTLTAAWPSQLLRFVHGNMPEAMRLYEHRL